MLGKWFKCVSLVLLITGASFDFAGAVAKKTNSSAKNTKKELNAQIKQLKQNPDVKEYLSLTRKYKKATKKNAKESSKTEQMKSRIAELEQDSEVKKFKELQEEIKQFDQKEDRNKDKQDSKASIKKDKNEKKAKKNKNESDAQNRLEELMQNADVQEYLKLQKQNKEKNKKAKNNKKEDKGSKNNSKSSKNEKKVETRINNDWRNAIAAGDTKSPNIVEPIIIADNFEKSTLKVEKDVGQAPVKEIETPTLVADATDSKNTDPVEPQQKLFDEKVVFIPQTSDEDVKKKITDISNDLKNYHLVKNVNKQVKNSTTLGMELRKDLERYRQLFANEKLANS